MDEHDWPCLIKTARQKRRLVLEDRDKQLLRLSARQDQLNLQKRTLAPVPVEQPYQRGWKRFFVLEENVRYSEQADFYQNLLQKINTTEYHYDKSFKSKRWKKGIGIHPTEQKLKEPGEYNWSINALELTEQEKLCFTRVETYNKKAMFLEVKYVFTDAWRFTLKVSPNIITHRNPIDGELEEELAWINNRITNQNLFFRLWWLRKSGRCHWHYRFDGETKEITALKNVPRYLTAKAYLEF